MKLNFWFFGQFEFFWLNWWRKKTNWNLRACGLKGLNSKFSLKLILFVRSLLIISKPSFLTYEEKNICCWCCIFFDWIPQFIYIMIFKRKSSSWYLIQNNIVAPNITWEFWKPMIQYFCWNIMSYSNASKQ
jgi:hypothetical protein